MRYVLTSRFPDSLPIWFEVAVVGILAGVLINTLFMESGSDMLKQGIPYVGMFALLPVIYGFRVLRNLEKAERADWLEAAQLVGIPRTWIRTLDCWEIVAQAVVGAISALLFSVLCLKLFLATIFAQVASGEEGGFPNQFVVASIVFLFLIAFLLLSLGGNPRRSDTTQIEVSTCTVPEAIVSIVALVVCIAVLFPRVSHAIGTKVGWLGVGIFAAFFFIVLATVLYKFIVSRPIRSFSTLGHARLAIRNANFLASPASIAMALTIFCLPFTFFGIALGSMDSSRYSAPVPNSTNAVALDRNGHFLSEEAAKSLCDSNSHDCVGLAQLSYVAAHTDDNGNYTSDTWYLNLPQEEIDKGIQPGTYREDSVFHQSFDRPWDGISADPLPDSMGWSPIFHTPSNTVNVPGLRLVPLNELTYHLSRDYMFGPTGTGFSEFIPLFSFLMISGFLIIFSHSFVTRKSRRTIEEAHKLLGASDSWLWAQRLASASLLIIFVGVASLIFSVLVKTMAVSEAIQIFSLQGFGVEPPVFFLLWGFFSVCALAASFLTGELPWKRK